MSTLIVSTILPSYLRIRLFRICHRKLVNLGSALLVTVRDEGYKKAHHRVVKMFKIYLRTFVKKWWTTMIGYEALIQD